MKVFLHTALVYNEVFFFLSTAIFQFQGIKFS